MVRWLRSILAAGSTDDGANWLAASQGLTSTYVRSLAVSPAFTTDRTLYAGTYGGGVLRSTDGGANWLAVNQGLTNTNVYAVALSPAYATDRTLYAGTAGGVFRSTDGGANWLAASKGLADTDVRSLAVSPAFAADRTLYAGTTGGVFRSTDGGATWQAARWGLTNTTYVQSLAVSPAFYADRTLYAGTDGGGVFRSTDGGATWQVASQGVVLSVALSPAYATDRTLYAGTNGGGVFRSTDGGATWQAASQGLTSTVVRSLAVSPAFAADRTLYAGTTGGVFRSTDGGAAWQVASQGLTNTDVRSLAVSPAFAADRTLYAGTWGGVFRYADGVAYVFDMEPLMQTGRGQAEAAASAVAAGRYEAALPAYQQALDSYRQSQVLARQGGNSALATQLDAVIRGLEQALADARLAQARHQAGELAQQATGLIETGDRQAQDSDYGAALEGYRQASSALHEALRIAQEHSLPEAADFQDRLAELAEAEVRCHLAWLESRLTAAQAAASPSRETFEGIESEGRGLDAALRALTPEAVTELAPRRDAVVRAAREGQAACRLEAARSLVQQGHDGVNQGRYAEARDTYSKARTALAETSSYCAGAGLVSHLQQAQDLLARLEAADRKALATMTQLPEGKPPAESIPSIPSPRRTWTPGRRAGPADVGPLPQAPYFPGELVQHYDDVRFIGEGGYARVYRSLCRERGGQEVALKVPKSMDRRAGDRFLRELQAWEGLAHPNILKLYEAHVTPVPHLEMEYAPQGSLDALSKPQEVVEAALLALKVADALAYAHGQGRAHGDIKPANILRGEDGSPKVSDWGLARLLADSAAPGTLSAGFTPRYAAPEHYQRQRPTERTDVYHLGLVLYELLTGRVPFQDANDQEHRALVLNQRPPPPSALNQLAQPLDDVVMSCLAKQPDSRPTATEVRGRLAQLLNVQLEKSRSDSQTTGDRRRLRVCLVQLSVVAARENDHVHCLSRLGDLRGYAPAELAAELAQVTEQVEYYRRNAMPLTGECLANLSVLEHRLSF